MECVPRQINGTDEGEMMSGYLRFNGTGFKPVDDFIQLIEDAGDAYHHTSQWDEDSGNDEPTYTERINAAILVARDAIADLTRQLAEVTKERDAALKRLTFLEIIVFEKHWDGCIDRLSTWRIWGGYRHVTSLMHGNTFAAALDKAMSEYKLANEKSYSENIDAAKETK
jgi:hypothetical protein